MGVSINEVQAVCPRQPIDGVYSHAGILFSPVAFGLAQDALPHPGPRLTSRIDLVSLYGRGAGVECGRCVATENDIVVAVFNLQAY